MALVRKLEEKKPQTKNIHQEVEASFFTLRDEEGNTYLQIESYGSPARKIKGKTSQSIQFDQNSAFQLFETMKREFGFK
ncbi:hypothetical protein SAMN04488056_102453 [Cohaesibacter marisflavi]|uniref:Methionyl-tRNA formyltransferase n=1 Tax=Cohaesibacter marisflavi TaxID=655353 RepID=A0A1I5D2S9_9HYPH|nr:hypothetical protein [Cohaesibacter marisflavi]SFN93525.1 hypothetical protein SAMN04488056_102453 [Cohaesibacter marisflavi]